MPVNTEPDAAEKTRWVLGAVGGLRSWRCSLVWHVRHALFLDGRPAEHFHEDGSLRLDEQDGDDVKLLGIFSSLERAHQRVERAKSEPGFRDEPDCFIVDAYVLDEDKWDEGFVTM